MGQSNRIQFLISQYWLLKRKLAFLQASRIVDGIVPKKKSKPSSSSAVEQYGINPAVPLGIARCESGFNQFSKNKSSTASGVYQWLTKSWKNQPASLNGTVSPFDADANVRAAVWLIAHGKTSPWNASKKCWNK